jgi:heme/copper-type cytochrome/quinol oxidase subunit 4
VATTTRREVLFLVLFVLALDAVFVVIYFLARVHSASDTGKVVFTAVWTLAILVIAVRGLARIRNIRLHNPPR